MIVRTALAVAACLVLLATSAAADRFGTPSDYPFMVDVPDHLASPHRAGEKVSVFGYPVCEAPTRCALLAVAGQSAPTVHFNAAALPSEDQARLMRCLDRSLPRPCTAVIYGLAGRGVIAVKDIWWRW